MKRKDIFFKTKRSVTLISAGIVFFCLLIFAIITTTLYTSRVFVNVDNSLIQEKEKVQKVLIPNPQDRQFLKLVKIFYLLLLLILYLFYIEEIGFYQ